MDTSRLRSLLWDVDPDAVDPERHASFLIARAFNEGTLEEIRSVLARYGRARVAACSELRALTPKGRALVRLIGR